MKQAGTSLLSYDEVARRLGVSRDTVHRYRRAGRLQAYKLLGRVVFKTDEVDRLLEPVPIPSAPVAEVEPADVSNPDLDAAVAAASPGTVSAVTDGPVAADRGDVTARPSVDRVEADEVAAERGEQGEHPRAHTEDGSAPAGQTEPEPEWVTELREKML